jgi:fucose permease
MSKLIYAPTLVDDDQGLRTVQWFYLGVACFVGLLIILLLLVPFPEITRLINETVSTTREEAANRTTSELRHDDRTRT